MLTLEEVLLPDAAELGIIDGFDAAFQIWLQADGSNLSMVCCSQHTTFSTYSGSVHWLRWSSHGIPGKQ
jgi:hypothetical protein